LLRRFALAHGAAVPTPRCGLERCTWTMHLWCCPRCYFARAMLTGKSATAEQVLSQESNETPFDAATVETPRAEARGQGGLAMAAEGDAATAALLELGEDEVCGEETAEELTATCIRELRSSVAVKCEVLRVARGVGEHGCLPHFCVCSAFAHLSYLDCRGTCSWPFRRPFRSWPAYARDQGMRRAVSLVREGPSAMRRRHAPRHCARASSAR
jgi:hypothetical protein